MKILGITDGQTSGAAIVDNGRLTWAINEERLVRMKHARGAPRSSISCVLAHAGIEPDDFDGVAIAGTHFYFKNEVEGWRGWFEERADMDHIGDYFFQVASRCGGLAAWVPGLQPLYYLLRTPVYRKRRKLWPKVLATEYAMTAPTSYYDHHLCHATSAYFTSGFDRALVVTMDGGGDGSCSHIYRAKGLHLERLSRVGSYDSLGNYYAYVTALCGYKAKNHEGKITGLAAYGSPIYYEHLQSLICEENGRLKNTGRVLFNAAVKRIQQLLPSNWKKEDLAASIQKLSEDICRRYTSYWLEQTGETNLALAGGVFANVRINQELNEIPGVERLFVHPGMSDEGLCVGAAYAMWSEVLAASGRGGPLPPVISDVYSGPEYSESEIRQALESDGLAFDRPNRLEHEVARLLADGYVVARFDGRMEYGPRALGNRSILYHPTDRSVNDWLNKNLVRTEFMPFAPATLYEDAEQCFVNMKGAKDAARFMTITFHCTPWMRDVCQGVVHLDGTARPQLVREQDNPGYYRILSEFRKITGIPSVINTSFNMHEEPIVCSPQDAIRAFRLGHLDYLAIGPFLVKCPGKPEHSMQPCRKIGAVESK